nr:MAG TPA_asm: hypothetical protein [Caudoviricetes sp.]
MYLLGTIMVKRECTVKVLYFLGTDDEMVR